MFIHISRRRIDASNVLRPGRRSIALAYGMEVIVRLNGRNKPFCNFLVGVLGWGVRRGKNAGPNNRHVEWLQWFEWWCGSGVAGFVARE